MRTFNDEAHHKEIAVSAEGKHPRSNELRSKASVAIEERLPKVAGKVPTKELLLSFSVRSFNKLPRDGGSVPLSWFPSKLIDAKSVKLPIQAGMDPARFALCMSLQGDRNNRSEQRCTQRRNQAKYRETKPTMLNKELGTEPVEKLLSPRNNVWILVQLYSSPGRSPVNIFWFSELARQHFFEKKRGQDGD